MIQTLDYSALNEKVSRADITAFKKSGIYKSPQKISVTLLIIVWVVFVIFALTVEMILKDGAILNSAIVTSVLIGVPSAALWISHVVMVRKRAKLYKFASRNDFAMISELHQISHKGVIFIGSSGQINQALRLNKDIEIGNYTQVTGLNKKRARGFGYAKIRLAKHLPHMLLDAEGNKFWKSGSLGTVFDRSQVLALEGDFNTYFTLYAPKEYERDALYVFTPDVMAVMIDHGKGYDIEIVDDELFIYSDRYFPLDKPEFYEHILVIIDSIQRKFSDQAEYYTDEKVENQRFNTIAPKGRRLSPSIDKVAIVIFLIVLTFYVSIFIAIIIRGLFLR